MVKATPRPALPPGKRPRNHCIGGPRAGLDGIGKSLLYRDSIPRPSGPLRDAVSSTPSRTNTRHHFTGEKNLWRINFASNNKMNLGPEVKCKNLIKFGISRQSFKEIPSIKFHVYPSRESRADTCGQTDGHEGGNRRFSRLCERK